MLVNVFFYFKESEISYTNNVPLGMHMESPTLRRIEVRDSFQQFKQNPIYQLSKLSCIFFQVRAQGKRFVPKMGA